jgi:hypothetical protein
MLRKEVEMAGAKTTSNRRNRPRARPAKATLTTALMVDSGVALPKRAARFTFKAPSNTAKVLMAEASKIKPLLQRYGEAIAKSRRAGRPVSFHVEVDPDGGAIVTPVEEAAVQTEPFRVEDVRERSLELDRALAAARERGRIRAAEILNGPDMVSAEAFAELLGTTRVTVNTKRQNGQVLGLDGAKRGFRFPVWQLNAEGKPYPELRILLERLGAPWAVYRLLVQRQGALGGLTGREALEQGKGPQLVASAEGIARGDFT